MRLNAQDDCKAVTVDYATADGTATAGEDYTSASGTLTFNPGETVKTISIPVLEDDAADGEETLTLTLSNPAGVELTDSEAIGTIKDGEPVAALTARFENVPETHATRAASSPSVASSSWAYRLVVTARRCPQARRHRCNLLSPRAWA